MKWWIYPLNDWITVKCDIFLHVRIFKGILFCHHSIRKVVSTWIADNFALCCVFPGHHRVQTYKDSLWHRGRCPLATLALCGTVHITVCMCVIRMSGSLQQWFRELINTYSLLLWGFNKRSWSGKDLKWELTGQRRVRIRFHHQNLLTTTCTPQLLSPCCLNTPTPPLP